MFSRIDKIIFLSQRYHEQSELDFIRGARLYWVAREQGTISSISPIPIRGRSTGQVWDKLNTIGLLWRVWVFIQVGECDLEGWGGLQDRVQKKRKGKELAGISGSIGGFMGC